MLPNTCRITLLKRKRGRYSLLTYIYEWRVLRCTNQKKFESVHRARIIIVDKIYNKRMAKINSNISGEPVGKPQYILGKCIVGSWLGCSASNELGATKKISSWLGLNCVLGLEV